MHKGRQKHHHEVLHAAGSDSPSSHGDRQRIRPRDGAGLCRRISRIAARIDGNPDILYEFHLVTRIIRSNCSYCRNLALFREFAVLAL
jgi:hypothetical protein